MIDARIAVQLYSIRDECSKNFAEAIKAVAEMGYEGVEFAGFYGWAAESLRDLLKELGLRVAGAHIGIESLIGEELEKTIGFHKTLGNENLIIPGLPENMRNSKQAWLRTAELFNQISDKLKSRDLRVGYHNHTIEFQKFDGETALNIFFKNTVPDVIMQIDTGHVLRAGLSSDELLELIRHFQGRVLTIHVKEYSSKDREALIGEGDIKWRDLLELCEMVGKTKWFIIEQETYKYPPLECIRRDLENLRKILGKS